MIIFVSLSGNTCLAGRWLAQDGTSIKAFFEVSYIFRIMTQKRKILSLMRLHSKSESILIIFEWIIELWSFGNFHVFFLLFDYFPLLYFSPQRSAGDNEHNFSQLGCLTSNHTLAAREDKKRKDMPDHKKKKKAASAANHL